MAFGEGQRLLWQQAASVLLLLLVSSPDYAQAQGLLRPPAADTSWIPSTNTASKQPVAASSMATNGAALSTRPGAGLAADASGTLTRQPSMGSASATAAGAAVDTGAAAAASSKQLRPAGPAGDTPRTAAEGTTGVRGPLRPLTQSPAAAMASKAAAGTAAEAAAAAAKAKGGSGPKSSSAAANPAGSLHNVLAKNAPLFRSLFTVLDISPEQIPETAVGTFFAPTDQAIADFLESMGLTAKQLAARPELVDLIVSYHFAPGFQLQDPADVADGNKILLTGDEQYILRIAPAAAAAAAGTSATRAGAAAAASSKLVLTDVQKSKATELDGPFTPQDTDGLSVYLVDKVLRSANYFLSVEAALSHSPYWISTKAAAVKADILPLLEGQAVTMFVPDNAAFKPVESNLSRASTGRLADILKYHVLPKVRRIPRGFESGTVETLLQGHPLEINIDSEMQHDPFSGNKNKTHRVPMVTITPEKRLGAPDPQVTYYNIYAGPAILHGISGLLLPDLPPDPNQLPPPPEYEPMLSADYEQPPDAVVAEEAGPGSLEEANKEFQGEDYDSPANAALSTATTQQKRTGPAAPAGSGARGVGTGLALPGGVNGASSSSSSRTGIDSMGPVAAAAGSKQTVAGTPAAAAAADPAGMGLKKGPAGANPVTTESGVSTNVGSIGASAKRPSSALLPVNGLDTSAATDAEGMVGSLGRRRLLLLPRSMLAAGQQTRRMLAAGLQTAQKVLGGRGLRAGMQRSAPRMPAATPATAAAAVASAAGVTPSGALSSTVNVGAVGELQSFVNGISSNRTVTALKLAGGTTVPKGYVNRYGAFKGASAKGGCLNCKSWGRQQPQ